jgi:adenylylsulfate kinase-like enzyme
MGKIIMIMGIQGAGKTTIANALVADIGGEVLDVYDLRQEKYGKRNEARRRYGLSVMDRQNELARLNIIAKKIAKYTNVVVTSVAPTKQERVELEKDKLVLLNITPQLAEKRDTSGDWKLAREHKIVHLEGLNASIVAPVPNDSENPLLLNVQALSVLECVAQIKLSVGLA